VFVNEFAGGQKIIQKGTRGTVDRGEGLVFRRGIETAVTRIFPSPQWRTVSVSKKPGFRSSRG
jgi:hypothetical protein